MQIFHRQERPKRHAQLPRARHGRPLGQRVERAFDVCGQHPHPGTQRQVAQAGKKIHHVAGHRPRPFREHHHALSPAQYLFGRVHRLANGPGTLHGHQVGEILEVGAPVAIAEKVVRGGQRGDVTSRAAERHLDEAHVEVRRMIRRHDEVGVEGDVPLPLHLVTKARADKTGVAPPPARACRRWPAARARRRRRPRRRSLGLAAPR